jgi:hypothetical protein
MHGLFAPHARTGDEQEVMHDSKGNTVVYDPEYPEWHLRR